VGRLWLSTTSVERLTMHFVVLGVHSPEVCPTSNAKSRALLLEMGPQIPKLAEQHGVKIVAGPYVNREHTTVVVAETDSAESLDSTNGISSAFCPQKRWSRA